MFYNFILRNVILYCVLWNNIASYDSYYGVEVVVILYSIKWIKKGFTKSYTMNIASYDFMLCNMVSYQALQNNIGPYNIA